MTSENITDTAALIAEALDYVGKDRTYDSQLIRRLAARTVQLAAVIAEAQEAQEASTGWHEFGETVSRILNRAPGDVLREHDAKVLEEFADSCLVDPSHGWGYGAIPVGRIKSHAAALRVGANPKENEHG